jgi:nucleotide-binding universal stress UspA family protein
MSTPAASSNTDDRLPLVVGIDGSKSATAALDWALDEARSQGAPVRLVCAFGGALTYGTLSMYGNLPVPDIANVRAAAMQVLADAAQHAAERGPDIRVTTHALDGDVAPVLIEESRHASAVVVGSRPLGAFGSVVLRSASTAVSARAGCPVVVIRGPAGLPAEKPAVVAGVDGLGNSDVVLTYAFDYASRHDLPLHPVLCWHPDVLAEMSWRPEQPAPTRTSTGLSEALAGWSEKYPDVATHASVVREHPVAGLVAAATAQHLLVVASRGHSALAGTMLGSVSQGVLHHATCPVAVVPMNTS